MRRSRPKHETNRYIYIDHDRIECVQGFVSQEKETTPRIGNLAIFPPFSLVPREMARGSVTFYF